MAGTRAAGGRRARQAVKSAAGRGGGVRRAQAEEAYQDLVKRDVGLVRGASGARGGGKGGARMVRARARRGRGLCGV
jgi:hypothetical protein